METKTMATGVVCDNEALLAVNQAFESQKAALAEVKAKGADGVLDEKIQRLDAVIDKALERLLPMGGKRPALSGGGLEPGAELKSAFDGYVRAGRMADLEQKGISVPGMAGGAVAPPETERFVLRRLAQASVFRQIAQVRQISANSFKKPVSTAQGVSGWVNETAARPETTPPTVSVLTFPTFELYAAPSATQALLDDSQVNIDQWLADEVQDSFAAQETQAFLFGDGVSQPQGLLSGTPAAEPAAWGSMGFFTTGAAANLGSAPIDSLLSLVYGVKAQYRPGARFLLNRRTAAILRKIKDAQGDYIWAPPSRIGEEASLWGYPISEIETMPDVAANAFPIAFGDFMKGYLIVDRVGLRVLRDPYSNKPYVLFYTTKRVGGGVQNYDAIKLLKVST